MSYLSLSSGAFTTLQSMMVLVMTISSASISISSQVVSPGYISWSTSHNTPSSFLCTTVLLVLMGVGLYSVSYMDSDDSSPRFIFTLGAFSMSMVILVLSSSTIMMITGWDGLGITSYFLVCHYPNPKGKFSSYITVFTNRVGDCFLLLFMAALLFQHNPAFNLGGYGPSVPILPALLLVLAGMTKSAVYPFSAWLPEAMAAPTPVSSLVHSSTLVLAGVWISLQFYVAMPLVLSLALGAFCSFTSLYSAFSALYCQDMKKIVALSTLSQVSFMGVVVSTGLSSLAVFHMVTHAMFKSALFMATGSSMHLSGGSQDYRPTLLSEQSSATLWGFSITLGSMSALPMLSGFFSKESVLFSSCHQSLPMLMTISSAGGAVLTLLYSLRVLMKQSKIQSSSTSSSSPQDPWVVMSVLHLCALAGIVGWALSWSFSVYSQPSPALSIWVLAGVVLGSVASSIPGMSSLSSQGPVHSSLLHLKNISTTLPEMSSNLQGLYSVWDKGYLPLLLTQNIHKSVQVFIWGHKVVELGFNKATSLMVLGFVTLSFL